MSFLKKTIICRLIDDIGTFEYKVNYRDVDRFYRKYKKSGYKFYESFVNRKNNLILNFKHSTAKFQIPYEFKSTITIGEQIKNFFLNVEESESFIDLTLSNSNIL